MIHSDGGRPQPARNSALLTFDQVSYAPRAGVLKRRRHLFDSLSFSLAQGEAVGFLLPEGAGKTSLVKLATGHVAPSFGAVSVLGQTPSTQRRELVGRVGAIVNEHSQLWFDLPLAEALALYAHSLALPPEPTAERRSELAERLELTRALRTPVGDLTRAQRRRAELVAALLPDPEVLILDEPTRGMDVASKERIRSVLRQENRMRGRTLLLVTGDLADVESLCPRMLVGVDGRIGFDGNVSGLTEILGTERVLVVDMLRPIGPLDGLPGTELIAVEAGGLRHRLGIPPGQTSTARVLSDVVARAPVRNLTLEEPDVSELVRRLSL